MWAPEKALKLKNPVTMRLSEDMVEYFKSNTQQPLQSQGVSLSRQKAFLTIGAQQGTAS